MEIRIGDKLVGIADIDRQTKKCVSFNFNFNLDTIIEEAYVEENNKK